MMCSVSMLCATAYTLFLVQPSLAREELDLAVSPTTSFADDRQLDLGASLGAVRSETVDALELSSGPSIELELSEGRGRPETEWAALHSGVLLGAQLGVLLANPPDLWPSGRVPDPEQFRRSWTRSPTWNDGDWWLTNYVGHPMMGAYLYVFARRTEHSIFASFMLSTLASLTWEYLIEAWWEQPSWTDILVTSTTGALLGEGMWWVRQRILSDGRVTVPEYVALALVDPITFLAELTGL